MTHLNQTYVIAEIGVNHNGDVGLAKQMIDVAAKSTADAVKFQTFFADELVTRNAKKAAYQLASTDKTQSQYDMLKALELSADEFAELNSYCIQKDIAFLSTPFSFRAVDLLDDVGVHAFKVSSGDLTYLQMLDHMARKGKPIILSTGMGNMSEIEDAVRAIEAAGNTRISILHCVSNYPAAAEDCNLAAMDTIAAAFGYPVGWSDHTQGPAMTLAAVARGAKIIEKHITLDVTMDGPDHSASMMPDEFSQMMRDIRNIEIAIGTGVKRPTEAELNTAEVARRSLTVTRDIRKGDVLVEADIAILRPGTGLQPKQLSMVLGQSLAVDVERGTPLTAAHFDARP